MKKYRVTLLVAAMCLLFVLVALFMWEQPAKNTYTLDYEWTDERVAAEFSLAMERFGKAPSGQDPTGYWCGDRVYEVTFERDGQTWVQRSLPFGRYSIPDVPGETSVDWTARFYVMEATTIDGVLARGAENSICYTNLQMSMTGGEKTGFYGMTYSIDTTDPYGNRQRASRRPYTEPLSNTVCTDLPEVFALSGNSYDSETELSDLNRKKNSDMFSMRASATGIGKSGTVTAAALSFYWDACTTEGEILEQGASCTVTKPYKMFVRSERK